MSGQASCLRLALAVASAATTTASGCGRVWFDDVLDASVPDDAGVCDPLARPWSVQAATFYGIGIDEGFRAVGVTASGDVIAGGIANATGYPGVAGGAQPAFAGGAGGDAMLVRFSADLATLQQATYFGGTGRELGFDFELAPDASPVILAWSTGGWPATPGAAATVHDGVGDDFAAARLSSDLTTTIGASYWNASDPADEQPGGVCVNPVNSDIYLAGEHVLGASPVFTAPGADLVKNGASDGALIRFDSALTSVLGNTLKGLGTEANAGTAGQPGEDGLAGCVVTPSGDVVYAAGRSIGAFVGTNATPGAAFERPIDVNDPFICRYSADLTAELACTHLGISGGAALQRDWAPKAMLIHPNGDLYIVVSVPAATTWLPGTPGAFQPASAGGVEVAITRLSADLSRVVASTFVGTSGDDEPLGAVLLANGSIAIGGRTTGTLATTPDAIQPTSPGGTSSGMLLVVDEQLTTLQLATYFGDAAELDTVAALTFDRASGTLVVSGTTGGAFPPTEGGAQSVFGGGTYDGFVARLSICD